MGETPRKKCSLGSMEQPVSFLMGSPLLRIPAGFKARLPALLPAHLVG